jgi:hypothetical protein
MANTWPIQCGTCGLGANADVVAGWPNMGAPDAARRSALDVTLWLKCPGCGEGSVKIRTGEVIPAPLGGRNVAGLPEEVAAAWKEARAAFSAGAFTAAEMMCRKILMHVAVDQARSKPRDTFTSYVEALDQAGYITTGLKPAIDRLQKRGAVANHQLAFSSAADSRATLTVTGHLLEAMYELPAMVAEAAADGPALPGAETPGPPSPATR